MFYSPLRYPGGKTKLAPFFEKLIIDNNLHSCTYIEPFAGGAGAALYLLLTGKVNKIIINDLDKSIYSFWKASIFDTDKFIQKIKTTTVNLKEWEKQRKIYLQKPNDTLLLGFATFYLNRTNRSGIIEGGPIGGMKQDGAWKLNARFNKSDLIDRIERISLFKNKIQVSNLDGLQLLKVLGKQDNAFIYLDPPYYRAGKSLYLNHYSDKHSDLAIFLNENNHLNWVLTYDTANEIKKLYIDRRIKRFPINYSARIKRKEKEFMIFSDSFKKSPKVLLFK